MYNGNKTEIDFFQLNLGYILNPTTNLKLEFSLTHRSQMFQQYDHKTNFYSMSLVSYLFNYYYDFLMGVYVKILKHQESMFCCFFQKWRVNCL